MNLGRIENVKLTSSTRTTLLLGRISQSPGGVKTLCMDMSMRVHYNRLNPVLSGEKIFSVCLYLSDWTIVDNRTDATEGYFTFTELKQNFTNRYNLDAKLDYDHPLIANICECVRKNLDMKFNEERDCFFEKPIVFQAQGNWVNRGWGETSNHYLVGVKLHSWK